MSRLGAARRVPYRGNDQEGMPGMPLIEVKLYEGRLRDGADARLIAALTDAVAQVLGDAAKEQTWVTLQEVPRNHWGIAGKPGA